MATSEIEIEGIGKVRIFRRKGLKYIRISIARDSSVRLSLPWYVPKTAGIKYLLSKKDWVIKHRKPVAKGWDDNQVLFDEYKLEIVSDMRKKAADKLIGNTLRLYIPTSLNKEERQQTINKKVKLFLINKAQERLIPLTVALASEKGFAVKEVRIKNLRSRWGSCSQEKVITLNAALLLVPSELIEYVIYHELAHTKHLHHGKGFWEEVEKHLPDYKQRRKSLKEYNSAAIM